MAQMAKSAQAALCLDDPPDCDIFMLPFVPRQGTQRHCDHLEKLQPEKCNNPRERRIETYEVAFLDAALSEVKAHGYWEVDGRSFGYPRWTSIVCCETFELLVLCPPGKRITLGNLDLAVILESCLEDANGDPFMRTLTSTSKCWPTGHVDFKWMLRGTWAAEGPAMRSSSISSAAPRRKSVKQLLSPLKRLSLDKSPEKGQTNNTAVQQTPTTPTEKVHHASETTSSRIQRWKSLKRWSPPLGGICASENSPLQEQRRHSLKERASSLFQSKRQSHASASSVSTSSSWYSRASTETS